MSVILASAVPKTPWGRALGWLAFLGPFFLGSYSLATWVTAQRLHVDSVQVITSVGAACRKQNRPSPGQHLRPAMVQLTVPQFR